MLVRSALFSGCLFLSGALTVHSEPAPPQAVDDPVASLSGDEIQELFQWLSRHAVEPAALSQEALNRAALRSLLAEGRSGARVLQKSVIAEGAAALPCHARLQAVPEAAYARPGLLTAANIQPLRTFLANLPPETGTLILDLRAPLPAEPLAGAALLAGLFLPDKTPLFQLHAQGAAAPVTHHTSGPRAWDRRLWLLVDDGTPPACELAAHLLVKHAAALTFGSRGRGTLTEFIDRPLGASHVIRLPSATVAWPDGTRLTGTPLVPQIPIAPRPEARAALMALTDPAALSAYLTETDRPRRNEAALIAGTDPELVPAPPSAAGPRPDPVLRQAVDLLQTTAFLKLDAPEEIKRAQPGK